MNGESEPTDEDIDTYIAQFEQENPQRPAPANADPSGLADPNKQKPDTWGDPEGPFGKGVLEQSQAAQAVKSPGAFFTGIKDQIMKAGGDPIKFAANGVMDMAKHSYENAKNELDHIGQEDKGDELTRWSRVAGAVASAIPVFGDLVKPMREGIPVDPNTPIDVPRVAGNAVGVGVDAALGRFAPEAGMAGIEATGRGMTRAGGAMAANASRRLERNAMLGPITPKELVSDLFSKRGAAALAATAVNPKLGAAVATAGGLAEAGKLAGRSNGLARLQQRIGRAMLPDAPNMWTGEAINPALLSDEGMIGPQFKPEVSGSDWSRAGAVRDPNLAGENTGVAYADRAPDLEQLWDDNPQANKHMDSVQDSSGDIELPKPVPTPEELWRASNETDAPRSLQDDLGDIAPEEIEPTVPKTPQEQWEALNLDDLEKSYQGGLEPWDATKGSQTNPPVSSEKLPLPEIKGKEGKRLLGEDQNRVSRAPKRTPENEGVLEDLDPIDNKDIDLDEPEITSRGGKLVDTTVPPKDKPKVEVVDKTIPFADLEKGNTVKTANGKTGTLLDFDEKSVTVKWENGTTNKIARKAVSKVENKVVPFDELPEKGSMRAPRAKKPEMFGSFDDEVSNKGGSIKRADSWKNDGLYDVTADGETHKVYRDPATNEWYLDESSDLVKSKFHIQRHLGYNREQAVAAVTKKIRERKLGIEEVKQARPKDEIASSELRDAVSEASLDEPIEDIFGSEPKRKASGARTKVEPQYPKAQDRLPKYKVSGEPTPRSEITNPRAIGDSPRQLGLNDRAIRASKVGWELTPEKIKKSLSQGQGHIQVNIDELFELAKKDINRPGRKNQAVGKSNKLERAQNFLASKNKEGVFTPEISVSNGKIIIDDGYHRTAAAKSMGEKSVPVRVNLQDLHLLKELGLRYRKLWDE
jgi:hypothetical protein